MDLITHGLITYKVLGKEADTVLMGIAPDIGWYLTYPVWVIRKHELKQTFSTGVWPKPPRWMLYLHLFTHSFIIAVCAVSIVKIITGRWHTKMLAAWLLHIAIDIPTHSKNPWGPRFLWPLSNMAFDGISWAETLANLVVQKFHSKKRV